MLHSAGLPTVGTRIQKGKVKMLCTGVKLGLPSYGKNIKQKLKMFEKNALRRLLGSKTEEVTGELRELHNRELHNLYSSPDIMVIE